ncbi:hypothetical protein CC1G_10406 [Coprinopsis cinerea okayama7|uniref:F-box domain-containing protein n=1 Tax=Coprinopsis cinerea (strain Okayama-7 / 130 / ATCC MYA-4618 / FGSC 9003) TaxID=240176 RepID=A8PAN9_COPC7|nr:hypothetical protein CC1G_10406 [Coprinopsis cinerea okayama7\|eukprot:XP_001840022.1 hypothetical protein CC1G_10406 [Coprinopsis cinerea okayama7\
MDDSALAIPLKDIGIKLWTWFIPLNQLSGPSMGPCKIDMLPFEILESIFLHFQADYAVDVPSPTPFKPSGPRKVAAAPVVLGAVCSHWRAVTLSIPTLWSKLWITVPRVDDITYVNRWVYRSGLHCPLDLRLDEPLSLSGSGPDPVVLSLLHTAISQTHRWRHVEFHLKYSVDHFLQAVAHRPLPVLRTFGLNFPSSWQLQQSLYAAPYLTSLRYAGPQINHLAWVDAPWEQLCAIEFNTRISWDVLAAILSRCSRSLRHLSIDRVGFDGIFHVNRGSIKLPSLRSLTLGPHLLQPTEFFGALDVPGLVELNLNRTFGYQYHEAFEALSRLASGEGSFRLRSFVWFEPSGHVGHPPQDFILHALSAPSPSFLDHLTHLRMVSPVTDAHLQALTCAKGSRKPLPRLKSLVLDQCWSTDGVLSSMVLSRNKTLRSVSAVLYGSGMILDPWFTRDLALQVPGVQLDIRKG